MPSVPTVPSRGFSFTDFAAAQPATPLPGQNVDQELDKINNFNAELVPWLRVSIQDDGTIKVDAATLATITSALTGVSGLRYRGTYGAGTAYVLNDVVYDQNSSWLCIAAGTGVAPPTLPISSNARWTLLARAGVDGAPGGGGTAATTTFTPAGGIAATNVQTAIQELDTEKAAASHTHVTGDITGLATSLAGVGKFTQVPYPTPKTSSYTITTADAGNLLAFNSGIAVTCSLPAVGVAGTAPYFVTNLNTGIVTLDPSGSETYLGVTTVGLNFGDFAFLVPSSLGWDGYVVRRTTALSTNLLAASDPASARAVIGALNGILDVQTFTTPGAATWTKPAGLNGNDLVYVSIWGAGGGGAARGSGGAGAGGGGGGAYVHAVFFASDLNATESVSVGAGGAGATGTGTTNPGGNGGSSQFKNLLTGGGAGAPGSTGGGGGGHGASATSANGGGFGAGVSGNDATVGGGAGGGGGAVFGGAGGGSGPTSGAGLPGSSTFYGGGGGGGAGTTAGGASGFTNYIGGNGGAGSHTGAGSAGGVRGGGGGGAAFGFAGGAGGRGEVRVWIIRTVTA